MPLPKFNVFLSTSRDPCLLAYPFEVSATPAGRGIAMHAMAAACSTHPRIPLLLDPVAGLLGYGAGDSTLWR